MIKIEIKTILIVSVASLIAGVLGFIFLSIIFGIGVTTLAGTFTDPNNASRTMTYKSTFPLAITVLTYLPEIIVVVILVVVLGLVYRAFD